MAKYRKRPIVVEAVQFFPDTDPWPEGVKGALGHVAWIETLEGDMEVRPGDWVITGIEGEKYPCKDSIFRATYEAVED